jgi:hypothetical protein
MRNLALIVMLFAACPSILTAEETAAPPQVTSDQVSQWVAELDSNLFDDRDRAQKSLAEAGEAAIDAVSRAAREGSLECSTRAVNILLGWSEADDHKLVLAALEKLATMENHPKQATLAKGLLADVRENIALEALEKNGATYQISVMPNGAGGWGRQQKSVQIFIGSEWKGDAEALKQLENVPSTYMLCFHSPPFGDEALAVLEKLPRLYRVEIYGAKTMSPEAIEEAKSKLPNIQEFDVRSGAFLGVQGDRSQQAEVLGVEPGSAAEAAGIKEKDIIAKLDGQEIKDFNKLTTLIAQHEPGDTVTISVIRARANALPEELDLKVTFAQWGKGGAGTRRGLNGSPIRNVTPATEPGNLKLDRR